MTAKVISLCDYRKSRDAEKRSRNVRGLGFPDHFSPFTGYDDSPEDFGLGSDKRFPFAFSFKQPIEGISLTTPDEEEE
jgi:hypothetical protein